MFEFHADKERYFEMQLSNSKEYIIPFIKPYFDSQKELKVMEIGCGEAGVLKAFINEGHKCLGVELSEYRVDLAKEFLKEDIRKGNVQIINKNIFDFNVKEFNKQFDLIILKDVIEHLPNQRVFIRELKRFLKPQGMIFFGFPPWYMPFGGHQQICKSKIAAILPYYHIFPKSLYKGMLKIFGEHDDTIKELMEIKACGISIERFEKMVKSENFRIERKLHYFINPIYQYKFNLKVRKQARLISRIPFFRNFLTTAVYYLIKSD